MSTDSKLKEKLQEKYAGKIVRKDLTKEIKEGANVPVYVLEYLLGRYCNSDDEGIIASGMSKVKSIIADNYVRPDEAEKILSVLRKNGMHTVIDLLTVHLNLKKDQYEAEFANLGLSRIPIAAEYPEKYDRLLCGGIWCIIQLEYEHFDDDSNQNPIVLHKVTPIQMPNVDINEYKEGRKAFTKEEWIDVLMRSIGLEPNELTYREKWLFLCRMIPLVENNFNLCELGPRSTGKSHLYKEISPNSILVSGGQSTVANLFFNLSTKAVGLVGLWDVVAFDEVAGINVRDKDGLQIMKDYMASGSFSRGKEELFALASMVFVGNVNHSIQTLLDKETLFQPFPPEMSRDTAFLDRIHCYNPGWEIPKLSPRHFTDDYGFISDYFAGALRELRKEQYGDAYHKYFEFGDALNQRDSIAVRKMIGGLVKLIYPDGNYTRENIEEILIFAMEMRRRVKEQLKRLDVTGEFKDVDFTYKDRETGDDFAVECPEEIANKRRISPSNAVIENTSGLTFESDPKYKDVNTLRRFRAVIDDLTICDKIAKLEDSVMRLVDISSDKEDERGAAEKFIEHYLKVAISVLRKFKSIAEFGKTEKDYLKVEHDTEELLDVVNRAADQILDDKYQGRVTDAETDLAALKSQLSMDGLLD